MTEKEDHIILVDEEGKEHSFVIVDILPVNNNSYAILMPYADKGNGNGEVAIEDLDAYIFRVMEKDGEQVLEAVEEEEEWNLVAEEWENLIYEDDDDFDSDA